MSRPFPSHTKLILAQFYGNCYVEQNFKLPSFGTQWSFGFVLTLFLRGSHVARNDFNLPMNSGSSCLCLQVLEWQAHFTMFCSMVFWKSDVSTYWDQVPALFFPTLLMASWSSSAFFHLHMGMTFTVMIIQTKVNRAHGSWSPKKYNLEGEPLPKA